MSFFIFLYNKNIFFTPKATSYRIVDEDFILLCISFLTVKYVFIFVVKKIIMLLNKNVLSFLNFNLQCKYIFNINLEFEGIFLLLYEYFVYRGCGGYFDIFHICFQFFNTC